MITLRKAPAPGAEPSGSRDLLLALQTLSRESLIAQNAIKADLPLRLWYPAWAAAITTVAEAIVDHYD